MKPTSLLLCAVLALLIPMHQAPAQVPQGWALVATELRENVGCINYESTAAGHVLIPKGPTYSSLKDSLKKLAAAHKVPGKKYIKLQEYTLRTGRPIAVAVVQRTINCTNWNGERRPTVTAYEYYVGPSEKAVQDRLNAAAKAGNGSVLSRILKWIDIEGDIREAEKHYMMTPAQIWRANGSWAIRG